MAKIGDWVRATQVMQYSYDIPGPDPTIEGVFTRDNNNGTILVMIDPTTFITCFGPRVALVVPDTDLNTEQLNLCLAIRKVIFC